MLLDPFTLTGTHVELVPLAVEHAGELVAAADADRSSFGWTDVPADEAAMAAYIEALLAQRAADAAVPFAQRRRADGALVGCTRFLELRWWGRTHAPWEVEVGGTWLAGDAQRSPINTEAKWLLLTHAFDTWRVGRLALCTDARNERSRAAIERLGARFEGILRHHRREVVDGIAGGLRDTALYALTDEDWPAARARLESRLR